MAPADTHTIHPTAKTLISFDRTIDRGLVHRAAVSEVFLTDMKAVDERTVLIGAQLPRCHGYFNDHENHGAEVDPLLLLEIARQATLGSAHALSLPKDTILISSDFELDVKDIGAFRDHGQPRSIHIESTFDWTSMRRGKPRAGLCKQTLSVNGAVAATHWSSGQLMSFAQLEALREEQRGDLPPWTADMTDRPAGIALPPKDVGRYNPLNVVLARLESEGDVMRASIAPPWQNRALFDHSYDHLTMQILTEAARQLAMLALSHSEATKGTRWHIKRVGGKFGQFAEIDLPVIVKTQIPQAFGQAVTLPVTVIQVGQEIASFELLLSPETTEDRHEQR